jgi:hypothetical protein
MTGHAFSSPQRNDCPAISWGAADVFPICHRKFLAWWWRAVQQVNSADSLRSPLISVVRQLVLVVKTVRVVLHSIHVAEEHHVADVRHFQQPTNIDAKQSCLNVNIEHRPFATPAKVRNERLWQAVYVVHP